MEKTGQEALDFWRDLVNYEGKHGEKDKLLLTAGFLREKFESIGLATEVIEVGEENAPIVTGVLNPEVPGKEILFTVTTIPYLHPVPRETSLSI